MALDDSTCRPASSSDVQLLRPVRIGQTYAAAHLESTQSQGASTQLVVACLTVMCCAAHAGDSKRKNAELEELISRDINRGLMAMDRIVREHQLTGVRWPLCRSL